MKRTGKGAGRAMGTSSTGLLLSSSCLLVLGIVATFGCSGESPPSPPQSGQEDRESDSEENHSDGVSSDPESIDVETESDTGIPSDSDDISDTDTQGSPACNGHADYCTRPYNQVAVPCTHNAMSNTQDWPIAIPTPNQKYSFIRQLNDGIRCLMLDTYEWLGQSALCHANCILGSTSFTDMLQDVKTWLESHPREIVTFILEAYISEEATEKSLRESGIWDYVYHHNAAPGSPWPTLGEMIENNQRLVVFTDDNTSNGEWHLNWQAYGFETPYDDPSFSCENGRGDPTAYDNQVFILNHYTLCPLGGCEQNGTTNNTVDSILKHAETCREMDAQHNPWGQIPTFINVDHYHVPNPGVEPKKADIFDAVDEINNS